MNLFYRHKGNPNNPKLKPLTVQQCFYLSTLRIRDIPQERFDMPAVQFLREIVKMSYLADSNLSLDSVMSMESLEMIYVLTFGEPDTDSTNQSKFFGTFNEETNVVLANEFMKELKSEDLLRGKFILTYYLHLDHKTIDDMPYFEFTFHVNEVMNLIGKGKKG